METLLIITVAGFIFVTALILHIRSLRMKIEKLKAMLTKVACIAQYLEQQKLDIDYVKQNIIFVPEGESVTVIEKIKDSNSISMKVIAKLDPTE